MTTMPTIERSMHIIPLTKIQESAFNPRKTFTGIDELASNIEEHGVLQPVLVRPVGAGYEIVFGARRLRASKKAKMTHIPCEIRELDDVTALELCVVENCQRVDVHPLEEAEGYEMLHAKHKLAVEEIAAKVNKSTAQIYARMKLLDLIPEARKAFYDGKLTAGVAIQLARLATSVQKDALKDLTPPYKQGDPTSVREATDLIARRYHLKLADAPFDRNDAKLVPKAGACGPCPKRTGNQTELFPDVKSKDTCTDAKCFAEKKEAAWKKRVKEATAAGVKVIQATQSEYSPPNGFIDVNSTCFADPKKRTFRELMKNGMPDQLDAIWKRSDGDVKELIHAPKVRAIVLKQGHRFMAEVETRGNGPAPAKPKSSANSKLERMAMQLARNAIVAAVERVPVKRGLFSSIVFELDMGAMGCGLGEVCERRGIKGNPKTVVAKMKEAQLRGVVAEMMMGITDNMAQVLGTHHTDQVSTLAETYGIDLKKIRTQAKTTLEAAEKTKTLVKRMVKPAKKKGRK